MRFGTGIPNAREGIFYPIPFANSRQVVEITQRAEQFGFESVWATDFVTPTPKMGLQDHLTPNWYETLISLAYLAAATKHIKLAAGVILLIYRDPVILAKQVATLDQFSGGRFIFGWGLGGNREEFESIQSKNRKANRGKMLEENMEALHLLLNSDGKVSFSGQYYEFHDVELNPKPLQRPLPIYIAGHSKGTPARIARWATGVSLSISAIGAAGDTVEEAMTKLRSEIAQAGKDLSDFDVEASTRLRLGRTHEEAVSGFRQSWLGRRYSKNIDLHLASNLVGTTEEVIEKVAMYEKHGINLCMTTDSAVSTVDEMLEQMQWFSEEVMSQFK